MYVYVYVYVCVYDSICEWDALIARSLVLTGTCAYMYTLPHTQGTRSREQKVYPNPSARPSPLPQKVLRY